MNKSATKVVKVRNPLRNALHGPRRISRDGAIEEAERNFDDLRGDLAVGLTAEIAKVQALSSPTARHLSEEALKAGIVLAPAIFNLAGALGYSTLQFVAASLHDLLVVMQGRGLYCTEPVIVHARAAQLAAPGMPSISKDEARRLLDQLGKIIAHFRDGSNLCEEKCEMCPGAIRNALK